MDPKNTRIQPNNLEQKMVQNPVQENKSPIVVGVQQNERPVVPIPILGKKTNDPIQKKLQQNKAFYYGFPLFVIAVSFLAIFFVIIPGVNKYFQSQESLNILNQNIETAKKSASNVIIARSGSSERGTYAMKLKNYIPEEAMIGNLINLLQTVANDFSLQGEFSTSNQVIDDFSSINDLATLDKNKKPIFQSLSSGEVIYTPKSVSGDSDAKLLSMTMVTKGTRPNLLSFVEKVKSLKPIVNLVYVDYKESGDVEGSEVEATLRFESYSLKIDSVNDTYKPVLVTQDSPEIMTNMVEETFILNPAIKNSSL